ncbi:hypothetical protein BsWGS_09363 [Bradybaena similaris]
MNQHVSTPETFIKADLPLLGQHHLSHSHRHHLRLHRVPSGSEEEGDEELDPRIQVELEKLNRASEDINRLEMELDDARTAFRQVLSESTQCLNALSRKLGTCVDKARPYYDARMRLKEAHLESQKAVLRFERSRRMHEAAREMVQLAEEGYKRREQDLDPTWQEMLNHATLKVNDAEKETLESEQHHHTITLIFKHREEQVQRLQKDLKKVIAKSRPYFDMKEKFHQLLENHKRCVSRLENEVATAKSLYSQTLHNLEAISDSIHQHRLEQRLKLQLGVREAGVGAEAPSPSPTCGKGMTVEGSLSSRGVYSEVDTDSLGSGQMFDGSKTGGDFNQLMRSTNTVSCDPVCNTNRLMNDASHSDEDSKGSKLAELSAFSLGLQSMSSLPKHPQICLSESLCQSEPRSGACQDRLGLCQCQNVGLPERKASCDAKERYCNNQSVLAFSETCGCPNGGCSQQPTSGSWMDSSLSQPLTPDNVELSHIDQHTFCEEQKPASSKVLTDVPISVSLGHPSKLSRSSEDPSNLSMTVQNCSALSLSLQGLTKLSKQTPSQLCVELTASNLHGMIIKDTMLPGSIQDRTALARSSAHPHQSSTPPSDNTAAGSPKEHPDAFISTNRSQPLPISSTAKRLASSQYSITCMGGTPEQFLPLSGSSGSYTKASKLKGIILQVDTAGILSVRPSVHQSVDLHLDKSPKVIISTHHPTLGVFIEKPSKPHYSESL